MVLIVVVRGKDIELDARTAWDTGGLPGSGVGLEGLLV